MKLTKGQLRKLIQEVIKEADGELSDEEYNILDIGPSHPHYHRVARKAERLGVTGAGPGGSDKPLSDWKFTDEMGAAFRRGAYEQFLKMIEKERGMAAIAEPMIALGLDPSDWEDRGKYKRMIGCSMALTTHLDRIIDLESDVVFKQYQASISGDKSLYDWTGELKDRCMKRVPVPGGGGLTRPADSSHDCVRFRMQVKGWVTRTGARAEHLYDRVKLYDQIMGTGYDPGQVNADRCATFDPSMLKKVLAVQADALRPMPAYTPAESETELEKADVSIQEALADPRYQKIIKMRGRMKVTKSKLKRIIREELQKINERTPGPPILRGGASFDLGFTDDGRSYDILLTPAMKTSVEQAAAAIAGPHISVEKVQATIEAHLKELLLTDRSTDGKNPTTKPVSKSDYGAAEAAREIFDGLEDPKSEELQKANITPDMEAIIKDELQRPGAATYCGGDAVKWIKFYLTQLLSDGEISRMVRSPGSSECWIPVAKKVYARIKNGAEEEFKPAHVGTSLQHGDQTVYAKGNKK